MGHAPVAADPSVLPGGYRAWVGDGFGNGDEMSSSRDGMLRSPTEKLRSPQSWATRETRAPSQSKKMPRGCARSPGGALVAGDQMHGEEGRDRQMDRHLPHLISKHFINAICTLSVADGEPSLEKTPSKGQSITLQAEGCFLKAMALYIYIFFFFK